MLAWIRSGAIKYKPYIKNKLIEIQELHPIDVWKFVPGKENTTADLISKGCKYKDLEKIIRGPRLLYQKKEKWLHSSLIQNKDEIDSEKNSKMLINTVTPDDPVIHINRFSSWRRLVRVTAYIMRFISKYNIRIPEETGPDLTAHEIKKAEK